MSFYDDASLVFLPSGGAGKDGKAYSIKPVEELGSELVTNGDFVNGSSNWSTYTSGSSNVVFSDNVATINIDASNSNVGIYQENVFSSGVQYRIVLRAKGTSSFDAELVESQAAATQQVISSFSLTTSYQDFVFTHTANGTNDIFIHRLFSASGANESIIIDSVSIKEITTPLADFTFSRGSNLTATRVDSNGLIEKGRENLLLQSNQFDTTWTTLNASVTSGQSGYDGSSDAWLLSITGGISDQRIYQTIQYNGVSTLSVFAKKNNSNWLSLRIGTSVNKWYDLENGVLGGSTIVANYIDASIEDYGNGWYRCSLTFKDNFNTTTRIYPADDDLVVTQTSGSIYIQDAQVEIGLVATEYIESGATTGLAGLLEDSPRFDYSGGASCPSLLLEPSRTNLITYSEYFNIWQNSGTQTIVANASTSPQGLQNASSIQIDSGYIYEQVSGLTISIGDKYIWSCYVNSSSQKLTFGGGTASGTDVYSSEDVGSGWYRQILTRTFTSSGSAIQPMFNVAQTGTDLFYIWGAQVEEGSLTSYIPNHSGGSVTRDADVTSVTSVSDLIGQTEGTIYCEFEYNGAADTGVFNRIIALGTGVTQNRILLAKNDTTAELVAFAVTGGTTQVFQAISGTSIIGHHKVAISYKANEYKVYLDGELEFTDSSASVPATTDVYVGTAEDGSTDNELGGVVKQSIIFKEVLSEDNCKALTTI